MNQRMIIRLFSIYIGLFVIILFNKPITEWFVYWFLGFSFSSPTKFHNSDEQDLNCIHIIKEGETANIAIVGIRSTGYRWR